MIDIEKMHASMSKIRHIFGDDDRATQSLGEVFDLINRLREAEKDSERYRWLRDAPVTSASEQIRHWMWSRPYGANMKYLDDAIDQAMKENGDE